MKNHEIKAYDVISEDGAGDVYRMNIPATGPAGVRAFLASGGLTAVKVRPGTRDAIDPISAACVADALRASRFGQTEIDLIVRTLTTFTDFVQ